MKQTEDNQKGSGAPGYNAPAEGGPESDDPLAAGSPRNLVPIAMAVILLFFAGIVFYIAASVDAPGSNSNWVVARYSLMYLGQGVFYPGVLIGLGTLATARRADATSAVPRVARLLSWAGAAVVLLGVAESVCIVGYDKWGGWRLEASEVALRMGIAVFEGGVLAGLALLCLRRAKGAQGL